MEGKTIAAIATAMSPGGISIIRISGDEAVLIIDKIFRSPQGKKKLSKVASHTIHYGYIYDGEELIDEVMVSVMRAPKSYTMEDTVEINCHGGVLITKKLLEVVLKHGATMAEPGEFTKRAFLNGRIDLSKAEAVIDLIHAKNEFAIKSSMGQLRGSVSKKIATLRDSILDSIAFIEAALDDPEHISIDGYDEELLKKVESMIVEMEQMEDKADNGRILVEGIKTVILGKPNAGKSSLLNRLAREERAIVTHIAGTTRDSLEEQIRIGGVSFKMIDTAGIRETEDVVEQIGVSKAKALAKEADLILYAVDSSVPLDNNDREIIELIKDKKAIILLNKLDLMQIVKKEDIQVFCSNIPVLEISAKEGIGVEALEETLMELFFHEEVTFNDEVYLTNIRQKNALSEALNSLIMVKQSIESGMPEDFFTIDLMSAYAQLGYIVGEEIEEDLVNRIFEKFCMGK